MYFVTADDKIVPCKYDQGSDSYVVLKRDMDPDDDILNIISIDGEEEEIVDYEIYDETYRVFFIYVYDEEDDESEDSESEGEVEDSEAEEDDYPPSDGFTSYQ